MTVLHPPPLPVQLESAPVAAPPARSRGGSRIGLVMMFLLCSALPILGATLYVWHRDMTKGGAGPLSGGFFYLLGFLFMYLIAALTGVMNCWHVVGGFVAACVYAWRGKPNRAGFWVMGAGYGLLSGVLLLDSANGGIGPKMQPLYFPIPATVAVWVVPVIGAVMTAGMWWAERAGEKAPA